jgi:hypothetical protein
MVSSVVSIRFVFDTVLFHSSHYNMLIPPASIVCHLYKFAVQGKNVDPGMSTIWECKLSLIVASWCNSEEVDNLLYF